MDDKHDKPADETVESALSELQAGLDGAKNLVVRTRFLLAGDVAGDPAEAPRSDPAPEPPLA